MTEWSELGGPSGKLFRFVSCVRARGAYVRSDLGEKVRSGAFPFPFLDREVFPFPSALQGPIQLQLALSVFLGSFACAIQACLFHPQCCFLASERLQVIGDTDVQVFVAMRSFRHVHQACLSCGKRRTNRCASS